MLVTPKNVDGLNDYRAKLGETAIAAFMKATRVEYENALSDLLANLMHFADKENFDFGAALCRAQGHYEAETGAAPY